MKHRLACPKADSLQSSLDVILSRRRRSAFASRRKSRCFAEFTLIPIEGLSMTSAGLAAAMRWKEGNQELPGEIGRVFCSPDSTLKSPDAAAQIVGLELALIRQKFGAARGR